MLGGLSPRLKTMKVADTTLLLTRANTTLAVNQANAFNWTAAHTWSNSATFNSSTAFNSTSSNYGNFYNYATIYNQSSLYNNSTFYQHGTFRTAATVGSIPFVDASQNLVYDADDFFRNNTTKRYGFGIGTGDTLLAKVHVVGLLSCTGTPPACSTYTASGQGTCESFGCTWNYNGSCSSYSSDEMTCESNSYCIWGGGTNCNTIGDEMTCNGQSPCSWSTTYTDCSTLSASGEGTCNGAGGGGYCSWVSNTCGSYGNSTDCNNASPCSWASSPCIDFNDNYSGCTGASGCTWSGGGYDCSSSDGTDQATCEGNAGCVWNSGANECQGSCSGSYNESCTGDNSYCGGSNYPNGGTCGGGFYGQSCQEDPACGGSAYPCTNYAASEGTCTAVSGCSWLAEPALYADGDFKIGFSPTQLGGFWGATPVARSGSWSVTGGYTTDKAFNPESTTTLEVARVLGTLIDQLKTYGILGS